MATETIKKESAVKRTSRPAAAHSGREPRTATASKSAPLHAGRYIEAVGRRKTAIARVRVSVGSGKITVNDMDPKAYFTLPRLVAAAIAPLEELKLKGGFDVSVHVSGGGIHAQSGAVRLGISRAIIARDTAWKPRLRALGFLTRDSRMVERKKYGKLKARKSPQWAKR